MKVVILCGGKGTRIRDVADDIPKPMIPIGNQPILWHIMSHYARYGFKNFVLCLGHRSWAIKRYFLDYRYAQSDISLSLDRGQAITVNSPTGIQDWDVTLAETGEDTMTGGRLKQVARYLTGERFMLTYGDAVSDVNLHALLNFHHQKGKLGTVTAVMPPGRFGEIELDSQQHVVEFKEKPAITESRISGGFFVFERQFLDRLPDDPGLILEREPLTNLACDKELAGYLHQGFWQCMDSSRDYQMLNQIWSGGDAPWTASRPLTHRAAA